ncbi:metal ABC transporter ATP-binding protein [Heyndrickxia ginsengihumi]|uniref:metal ABC transporter ATP-binding protein n=1 Tax=Heyndrickxia ginsengihumi TaxID=363870 RepID=UPI0004707FA6|nr:metal ABC transporter ATP-binding protein [Heyndrickxia ginsengihumi]MBE6183090.1 metal ABC transporter ATP-binding protein [Bacillus sp. (in: firmicutes)]MCM3022639.1 metal ABC transporter ATP-binding protein [Heyndrickxia ginsengihumi]
MIKTFEVSHLQVHFNGEKILNDLSFKVTPGTSLGIIGPNGAGKSTLLKVILGLIKPNNGTVMIEHEHQQKVKIGYVPQSRTLDEETPVQTKDFVALGLHDTFRPWLSVHERQLVRRVMEWTDTWRFAKKSIGKLSGGERQRAFLAQALVKNPDVLLLDESTANLDPGAQQQVMELVESIARSAKITVICVSHDLAMVKQFTEQVLYMTRNHYEFGNTKEMLTDQKIAEYYTCQHVPEVEMCATV